MFHNFLFLQQLFVSLICTKVLNMVFDCHTITTNENKCMSKVRTQMFNLTQVVQTFSVSSAMSLMLTCAIGTLRSLQSLYALPYFPCVKSLACITQSSGVQAIANKVFEKSHKLPPKARSRRGFVRKLLITSFLFINEENKSQ